MADDLKRDLLAFKDLLESKCGHILEMDGHAQGILSDGVASEPHKKDLSEAAQAAWAVESAFHDLLVKHGLTEPRTVVDFGLPELGL